MYFKLSSVFYVALLCFLINFSFGAPIEDDEEESSTSIDDIQLLDHYQSHQENLSEFRYELSDGNMREEQIKTDDIDHGIAVRGSYTIELADGEMQTIYYISDVNGHRISINKPFPEEEINRPRIATNWRENEEKERQARSRVSNVDTQRHNAEEINRSKVKSNGVGQAGSEIEGDEFDTPKTVEVGSKSSKRESEDEGSRAQGRGSNVINRNGQKGAGKLNRPRISNNGSENEESQSQTQGRNSTEEEKTGQKDNEDEIDRSKQKTNLKENFTAKIKIGYGKVANDDDEPESVKLDISESTSSGRDSEAEESRTQGRNANLINKNAQKPVDRLSRLRVSANGGKNEDTQAQGRSIEDEDKSAQSIATTESKDRFTQPPKLIPTRVSKARERPRVASLPDRPKNIEFLDDSEEKKDKDVDVVETTVQSDANEEEEEAEE